MPVIHHYTYSILHIPTHLEYLGTRSTNLEPKDDIGIKYFSSSSDKEFKDDQRKNPDDYRYLVLNNFDTREEALKHEIYLHNINDVGRNPKFINRAKQTATGFDAVGLEPPNKGKTNIEMYGEEEGLAMNKRNSERAIIRESILKADPVRKASRSANMSKSSIIQNAELNSDPVRSKKKADKIKEASKIIREDPLKRQQRSKNHAVAPSKAISINGKKYNQIMEAIMDQEIPFNSYPSINKRLKDPLNTNYVYITKENNDTLS